MELGIAFQQRSLPAFRDYRNMHWLLSLALVFLQPLGAGRPLPRDAQSPLGGRAPPATSPPLPQSEAPGARPGKPSALDHLLLPSGAVVVVAEDLKQALNLSGPGAVVLSAERYQALMELATRTERVGASAKADAVLSACRLSGQVVTDAAGRELLDAQITVDFRTQSLNAVVPIGLKGVRLTKALLDGETPIWGSDRNGLSIQIREPKICQLVLQAQITVTRLGLERKVVLEHFPAAAITSLDVTLPQRVQSAAVKGSGPLTVRPLDGQRCQIQSDALGVLEQLELSWQLASDTSDTADAKAAVTGDLRVTMTEGTIDTDARLRVEGRQGLIKALKLRVAPNTVVLRAEDEVRNEAVSCEPQTGTDTVTLLLKQPLTPGDAPLLLRLRLQNKYAAKPGSSLLIGQCVLLEPKASIETGTIAVFIAPEIRGVHWQHANMHRADPRDLISAENRTADFAYRYWQQPVRLQVTFEAAPVMPPIVTVRPSHTLRFSGALLTLSSEFEVLRIARGPIGELTVQWPKGWSLGDHRGQPAVPAEFDVNPSTNLVHVRFPARPTAPFKFKLEGTIGIAGQNSATIALPTIVLASTDRRDQEAAPQLVIREGEVRILPEDLEVWLRKETTGILTESNRLPDPDLPLAGPVTLQLEPGPHERTRQLALGWQRRRLDVESRAEVYLTAQEMHLEQSLRFQFSGTPPAQIGFRAPLNLLGRYQLRLSYPKGDGSVETRVVGWTDAGPATAPLPSESAVAAQPDSQANLAQQGQGKVVIVPREAQGSCTLSLVYRRALSARDRTSPSLHIPLLQPQSAEVRTSQAEVRFWTSSGLRVQSPAVTSGWQAAAVTPVAGTDLLPNLELHADNAGTPLIVPWETVTPLLSRAAADRGLIEVRGLADEKVTYRVRIWFSRLRSESLAISLPGVAPLLTIDKVLLNQHELPLDSIEAGMDPAVPQTHLRIPIPARSLAQPALLDLRYACSIALAGPSPFQRELSAPGLDNGVITDAVRWRVEWPNGWLPFGLRSAQVAEQPWRWLFGVVPPAPALLATDLDRWLLNVGRSAGIESSSNARSESSFDDELPALSFVQLGDLQPLHLWWAPRQAWLLTWSLAALLIGLAVYFFPPRWPWFWLGLAVIAVLALGLLLPQLLVAILFGIQPGLIVLTGTVLVLWLRQQRWRRQVVLLPGFARVKAGSSLARTGSSSDNRARPRPAAGPLPSDALPESGLSGRTTPAPGEKPSTSHKLEP